MWSYLVKRLLLMIPTLLGIVVIAFTVIHLAPGDPASQKFGGVEQATSGVNAERGTEAAITQFRKRYHLDKPLYIQFVMFLKRLATGDLQYYLKQQSILPDLWSRLQVTMTLSLIEFVLVYLLAIPLGIHSAAFPNSASEKTTTVTLFVLYSLPSFWVATMLLIWFSNKENPIWFPVAGLHSLGWEKLSYWNYFWDYVHHITLPVICMTYGGLAYVSRQMRAGMREVLRQDYIRTARAKGLDESRVILIHALRNGLFPIITLFSGLLPFLIGGSVIVESIFTIPGMGQWAFQNVLRREYDAVMAVLILSAVLTLIGMLLSDIMYVLVNPQVSFESRS